jgi:hypothetical protein
MTRRLPVAPSGVPIENETYRARRQVHGRGGDFLVFSNLKRVRLDTPSRFIIGGVGPQPSRDWSGPLF